MKVRLKAILSRDVFFYGILISLIILLGQIPIILHYFHNRPGHYYPFLDRISFSDYYYLALIRFGMGKDWLLKIPYVTLDHQGSLIQVFFVFLGKLSLVTGIGPAEMFFLFRIIGGVIFALSVSLFLRTILSKNQARLVFLFFLLVQPLSLISLNFDILINQYFRWTWHFGEAARRISAMPPHYTIGKGLTILALYFLLKYCRSFADAGPASSFADAQDKRVYPEERSDEGLASPALLISMVLTLFLAGLIYPPPVFIVAVSLAIAFGVDLVRRKFNPTIFKSFQTRLILLFILASLVPLLILRNELAKGYPWSRWNEVELGWNTPEMRFELGYLQMLGIFTLLVPFSLKKIFAEEKSAFWKIFILVWFVSPFILFPFANVLRLGKFRFIEGAQIVPMAVLVFWGAQSLKESLVKFKLTNLTWIKTGFFVFLAVNFLVFNSLSTYYSTASLWSYYANVYFTPDEQAALSFLNNNVKDQSIIMADGSASNYIPAFARVQTIIGFSDSYRDFAEFKQERSQIEEILRNKLKGEEVKTYLVKRKVDYIYKEISSYGGNTLYPSLVDEVYRNKNFQIYKVRENIKQVLYD